VLIRRVNEDIMAITVQPDWWKTLFDEIYLKTDARSVCDEELTRREVEVVCDLLSLEPGNRILDLCGGQGRHSLFLWERSDADCTVVDFSSHLVKLGQKTARERGCPVRFIQGDARDTGLPDSIFDHVIIMGNSLGYLPEPDDDVRILKEAYRLMKPGSNLLVDITDGEKVRMEMTSNAWHRVDEDLVVCRQRELDNGVIKAREMVLSCSKGLVRDQSYAIRLFTPDELEGLMVNAGFVEVCLHRNFRPHDRYGDYGFMNRRILTTAKKPREKGRAV
jgi:D-alanine-D-alanine ligase